jgi:low affinity Fe/Cu permease
MKNAFRLIANKISQATGSAATFLLALGIVIAWAFTGPMFDYSDTWQLVINTGTTIVTFLMVFLIQNTQNRDTKSVHLKLDELIHSVKGARTQFIGLEDLSDDELRELDSQFHEITKNPNTVRAMAKLHAKIDAEHQRRQHLKIGLPSLDIFHHAKPIAESASAASGADTPPQA